MAGVGPEDIDMAARKQWNIGNKTELLANIHLGTPNILTVHKPKTEGEFLLDILMYMISSRHLYRHHLLCNALK